MRRRASCAGTLDSQPSILKHGLQTKVSLL